MGKSSRRERRQRRAGGAPGGPAPAPAPPPPVARARVAVLWGLLALATFFAYRGSFQAPFLLDDRPRIEREQAIRPPASLSKWLATPRPVVTATLAFDYARGEQEVGVYHRTNLVLHLACGLLLFGFTRHVLRLPALRPRYGAAADPLAISAAALFLLHPIQTESVSYTIQRAEILSSAGLLGALWAASAAAQSGPSALRLAALAASAAFSTLSKPIFAVFPLLFLLYDLCLLAGGQLRALRPRAPLYGLLAAAGGLAALFAWSQIGASSSAGFELAAVSPRRYFLWQLGVLSYSLRLVLWPDRLCFDCGVGGPWPVVNSVLGDRTWLHVLLLLAIGGLAWGSAGGLPSRPSRSSGARS